MRENAVMSENWQNKDHWKDYYQILQVHPSAEPEVIKVAHDKLLQKYHPDHNPGKERWATEKSKEINEAFEILGNAEKKARYDSDYSQRLKSTNNVSTPPITPSQPLPVKPQPEVNPTIIRFIDVMPGEKKKDSCIVKNSGGPYSKILMSNPSSWLKIVSQKPLYEGGKLPLFVEIEVNGDEWGKTYVDNIIIKFDDVETHVRVELHTRSKNEPTDTQESDRKDGSKGKLGVNYNGRFYERYRLGKSPMDNKTQTLSKTCKGCGVGQGNITNQAVFGKFAPFVMYGLQLVTIKHYFRSIKTLDLPKRAVMILIKRINLKNNAIAVSERCLSLAL